MFRGQIRVRTHSSINPSSIVLLSGERDIKATREESQLSNRRSENQEVNAPNMSSNTRRIFQKIRQCAAPKGSLLEKHGAKWDYIDCFTVRRGEAPSSSPPSSTASAVPAAKPAFAPNGIRSFADSFYSCAAFYPESWVLWAVSHVYTLPPLPNSNNPDDRYGYGLFRVLEENESEIILDSEGTQTWMKVVLSEDGHSVDYSFGSVVKHTNADINILIPPHVLYSKILLASAVAKSETDTAERSQDANKSE
mmetsp:Transcript_7557/g.20456  ORF Transcript_7557/g.20456 Transcript_7557/m.20456 type:complete len:251 (+) Transcript_7557:178-930(+)